MRFLGSLSRTSICSLGLIKEVQTLLNINFQLQQKNIIFTENDIDFSKSLSEFSISNSDFSTLNSEFFHFLFIYKI